MSDAIIVALITAGFALLGQVFVGKSQSDKTCSLIEERMSWSDRLTENQIERIKKDINRLSDRVDKHNGFGEKIPVMQEQIKVINHRLDDLEHHRT